MAIADGLGLNPKDSPETCHHNLIRHGGNGSLLWNTQRYDFEWELGGHCTRDGFYMHQVTLAYMAVYRQVSLESGHSDTEQSALTTGPLLPAINRTIFKL